MRYYWATDGEWILPVRRGYRWRCCDCGKVHVVDFRIRNKRIEVRATTDYRATAQIRRRRKRQRARARKQKAG